MTTPDLAAWLLAQIAECDAKRQIVELHHRVPWEDAAGPMVTCGCCGDMVTVDWPCPTLRLLASVYKDREGYREEWAP